jgi:hypothetical protein
MTPPGKILSGVIMAGDTHAGTMSGPGLINSQDLPVPIVK